MAMLIREPAVSRTTLISTAAAVWAAAGLFLIARAGLWLSNSQAETVALVGVIFVAVVLGFVKGRFFLARLARKNIQRINELSPQKEKICVFAFQAMQSYLVVLIMIGFGIAIRMSPLPRLWVAGVYLLIGVGLVVGSVAYVKR